MTRNEFNDNIIQERIKKILPTFKDKNNEYGANVDVFHNFHNIANMTGQSRETVLWVLMAKHLSSIYDMVVGNKKATKEAINEKIGDAVIYLILLEGMLKDNINNARPISRVNTILPMGDNIYGVPTRDNTIPTGDNIYGAPKHDNTI